MNSPNALPMLHDPNFHPEQSLLAEDHSYGSILAQRSGSNLRQWLEGDTEAPTRGQDAEQTSHKRLSLTVYALVFAFCSLVVSIVALYKYGESSAPHLTARFRSVQREEGEAVRGDGTMWHVLERSVKVEKGDYIDLVAFCPGGRKVDQCYCEPVVGYAFGGSDVVDGMQCRCLWFHAGWENFGREGEGRTDAFRARVLCVEGRES